MDLRHYQRSNPIIFNAQCVADRLDVDRVLRAAADRKCYRSTTSRVSDIAHAERGFFDARIVQAESVLYSAFVMIHGVT